MDGRRVTRAAAKAAAEAAAQGEDSDATRVAEQTSEQPRAKGRGPTKRKTVTFAEPPKGRGKGKGKGKVAKGTDADDTVGATMQRKVKLITEQNAVDKPSPVEEFPMREWTIKLVMIDDQGNEHPADCFNKVVYHLHPSFENPMQTFTKPPFACNNEGWGEFEMDIDCYYTEKTKLTLKHDLNFQQNRYESIQNISFKNPSQALQEKLRELGPLPDDDARPKKKGVAGKKSSSQKYDFEKIAEALEKLEEDDLLKIIQMINDHKTADTYIKSDVDVDTLLEAGEFSIDLYTMPDILTKMLWDHLSKKGLIA